MGLFASSILVKYSLLNNSGSLVYAGTSSNSLRLWGAQLELAEYSEDILNDYLNNYRYMRTAGATQSFYGLRFGSGANGDQSVDFVVIGGTSGSRSNNTVFESVNFFINRAPQDSIAPAHAQLLIFNLQKRIKDTPGVDGTGVTVSDDRRRIPSNPIFDAARVAGLELYRSSAQTFSLNRYTPVTGDNVYYAARDWFSEVGRSQRARMAIGGDTEVHFFDKRLDEVKPIPQNPRFDALRVMGLEPVYKTSSIINLARYTPVHNADYTYYRSYDWYSEVPRSQRARLALGIGDGSPLIFDNLQFVEDFISLPTKGLSETIVMGYGTSSQTSRLAGSNDPETQKYTLLLNVKRGKADLYTINNRHQTSSDAIQTQEVFYNKPGSIFGRRWYQLAPYFSNYDHVFDSDAQGDNVRVGDYHGGTRHSNNRQETMAMLFSPRVQQQQVSSSDVYNRIYNKRATIGAYNSSTLVSVMRTNRVLYSERLYGGLWATSGISVVQTSVLLSASLPYRNVSYDADQLAEIFYNRTGVYQPRRWYNIVPLATRTSFTSTGISLITLSSSNSQHYVQTQVTVLSENYFSAGMYVKRNTGINKVRLFVGPQDDVLYDLSSGSVIYDLMGSPALPFDNDLMSGGNDIPHYADFDLSSITVINSVNVNMANIVDRGNGWYLIKILGPIQAQSQSSYVSRILSDTATILDDVNLDSTIFTLAPGDLLTNTSNSTVDLFNIGAASSEDLLI